MFKKIMLFFLVFSSLSHTPLSAEMSVGTTLLKGTSIAICGVAGTILTSHYIFKFYRIFLRFL